MPNPHSNSQTSTVFRKTALAQSISAAVVASVAGTAAAQEIEEITVTATKRAESIQDVPLAITAFTGDFVKDVNLDDVKDLVTFSPGVSGNSTDAFIDGISVRGVRTQDFGVGGDPSAAYFKNNLYEGRNGAVVTSLYDLERAEVLRGPQGFLFGRNAIGGAFSVHTKKPTLGGGADGNLEIDIAERGHFVLEGGTNFSVSDNFALRLALYHSKEDGWVRNIADGRDYLGHNKLAGRLSGLWGSDRLEVFGTIEYEDFDRDGSQYRVVESSPRLAFIEDALGPLDMPADPRGVNSDNYGGNDDNGKVLTLGLHVDYDFDDMALSWSTGYKDHDYYYAEDYDGSPRNLGTYIQDQRGDYLQSELRLTSTGDGPLSWYAGVSLYEEDIDVAYTSALEEEAVCAYYGAYYGYYYPQYYPITDCATYFAYWDYYYYGATGTFVPSSNGQMVERTFIQGRYSGWAAYVDLSYAFSDSFDVSFGVRHTDDTKDFYTETPRPESMLQSYFLPGYMTAGLSDSASWSDTTMRLVARWMPSDSTTLFASYTEGYKSGGFGTFSILDQSGNPSFQWFGDGPDPLLTQADGWRPAQFKPEDAVSYEVGYKGILGGGRAQWDVTAFMYDYEDLQVNFFDGGAQVGNAGQVDGSGIESTLQWAMGENWDLTLSAGYLTTEATGLQFLCGGAPDADGILDGDPDACEGSDLHWAPEWMGSGLLKGTFPFGNGNIVGNLEMIYEGERGGGYEDLPESKLSAFTEWNFRIGYYSDDNWNITAYAENLTDELTYAGAQTNGGITPTWVVGPNRPRTVGIRVGVDFD